MVKCRRAQHRLHFYRIVKNPLILVLPLGALNGAANFCVTDIKYTTLGLGYINYVYDNLKLVTWLEKVTDEKTQLAGYRKDVLVTSER